MIKQISIPLTKKQCERHGLPIGFVVTIQITKRYKKPYWQMIKEWMEKQPDQVFSVKEITKAVFCEPGEELQEQWVTDVVFAMARKHSVFKPVGEGSGGLYSYYRLRHPKPKEESREDRALTRARIRQIERTLR